MSSAEAFYALFDRGHGYLDEVRRAVSRKAPSTVRGIYDDALSALTEDGPRENAASSGPRPLADAAKHLRDFASRLAHGESAEPPDDALLYWTRVGMFPAAGGVAEAGDREAADFWCSLLSSWLRGGLVPQSGDSVKLPVVYVARDGVSSGVATLTLLALKDGPKGLFAAPEMSLFFADATFANSLQEAWAAAGSTHGPVLWTLETDGRRLDHLTGDSAGAAFAAGLRHIACRAQKRWRAPRKLERRAAITAAVDSAGRCLPIGDLSAKASTAAGNGIKTLVIAKDQVEDERLDELPITLLKADDVPKAELVLRAPLSRSALAIRGLVALLIALVAVGALVASRQAAENRNAALLREAQNLRDQATAVGESDGLSRQAEARLLLSAQALASAGGSKDLADSITSGPLTSKDGVLAQISPNLSGAVIHLTEVGDGEDLLADTDTGELALIDPQTYDTLGTFTFPPGILSLAQPAARTVSPLRGTDLVAVVFQDPIRDIAGVDTHASLVVLSATGGGLIKVGEDPRFTTEPVTASTYWGKGSRFLTATDTSVTLWNSEQASPYPIAHCRWNPGSLSPPVAALDDARLARPLLVLGDGEVRMLPPWSSEWSTCRGSRLRAPARSIARSHDIFQNSVSAGFDSRGKLRVFLVDDREHLLEVGPAGAGRRLAEHVQALGAMSIDSLPIQARGKRGRRVEFLSIFAGKVSRDGVSYQHEALPATRAQGQPFAVDRHAALDSLDPGHTSYVPAGVSIGLPRSLVNAVAAGEHAVALAYPFGFGVYTLTPQSLATTLSLPPRGTLADGDGRANSTLSLSPDGRYLAAILDIHPVHGAIAMRRLYLWDVIDHVQITLPATPVPLTAAFSDHGTELLVSTYSGEILAYRPAAGRWTVKVLHPGQKYAQALAAAVGPGGLYRVEAGPPHSTQAVVRYSPDGRQTGAWRLPSSVPLVSELSSQNTPSQLIPLATGGALFVLDSGTAYLLYPTGAVSGPIALGNGSIISGTDIAARHEVMLAGYGEAIRLDDRTGVIKPKPELGALTALTATLDGNYLIASAPLNPAVLLLGLTQRSRIADLCQMADGLTRNEWREAVGSANGYQPVCSQFLPALKTPVSVARNSERIAVPLDLTPVLDTDEARLERVCGALQNTRNAGVIGSLGWSLATSRSPGVICHAGRPLWEVPADENARVVPGGSAGSPLLLFSSARSSADPRPSSEIISGSGTVALRIPATPREIALVGYEASVFQRFGDIHLTTQFGRLPDTSAWGEIRQQPGSGGD